MAEPWDSLRATFPTNTEGLITASTMVNQVNVLETEDLDNVKQVDLEVLMRPILDSLFVPYWKGVWESGEYVKGDLVLDEGWLMIANKTTSERAAPQPVGPRELSYETTPPWTVPYDSHQGLVWTGMYYEFSKPGWLQEIAVYIPELSETTSYRFLMIDYTGDEINSITTLEDPVLKADSWTTIAFGSKLVSPGEKWLFVIDALNASGTTPVTGGWTYQGTGGGSPSTSGWNTSPGRDILRIDKTDLDSTDRTSELLGMVPGTTLQFVNTLAPSNAEFYHINTQPVDQGTYIQWNVSLTNQTGSLPTGEATTMTADVPVPQPTKYVEAPAYYPGASNPSFCSDIGGYKRLDGVTDPGVTNYAYGFIIAFQEMNISDDWEILAASDSGGSATFSPTYDYHKELNFTVPSDIYSEVARLTTPNRPAGTYEVKFSWTATYDSVTNPQYYRYTTDDGASWNEFVIEASDVDDVYPFTYFYPIEHDGGEFEIIFQARKGNNSDNHEILFLDLIFERKP